MEMKMSDQNQNPAPKTPRLSPDAPVDAETLAKFETLTNSRLALGDELLDLEIRKVRLLAAAQRIDNEKSRLWEIVCMERGLPLTGAWEIDPQTGVIDDVRKKAPPPPTT
jgi:hypothetical protein